MRPHLLDFDTPLFAQWLSERGYPSYRAKQLVQWIHQKREWNPEAMTNLPRALQQTLIEECETHVPLIISEQVATDGTIKWLFDVGKHNAIEAVFIPEDDRGTLCVSSQIGCAMACSFCFTGDQGFNRSLRTSEILVQLQMAEARLQHYGYPHRAVTNVVFMGMGEPLTNESALYPALHLLLDDHAYGLSKYRVTVSTSGIVPAMKRLRHESDCALAVSLHAPTDALRNELVPVNQKYPLALLKEICQNFFPKDSKRGILFEYVMLDQINDHEAQAVLLAQWLSDIPHAKVNLIPFNPYPHARYQTSSRERMLRFQAKLKERGIFTTIRKTRGETVLAACGQLAGQVVNRRPSHQQQGVSV